MPSNNANNASKTNITIFYAPEDQKYFEAFEKHLNPHLRKIPTLNATHEGKILAHQDTKAQIEAMLNDAHIVILLLSIDLENCATYDLHRQTIIDLHTKGKIAVLPVRLRHHNWNDSDWNDLAASPKECIIDGKKHQFITDYNDQDLAFTKVIADLDLTIANLQKKQLESQPPPGERQNNQFWIMVLSSRLDELAFAGLTKKQSDKLSSWSKNQYGEHIFDWKPFTNEATIGNLLQEYATKSKFDVQTLQPAIYNDFHTISTHKNRIIIIVDCLALSYCNNKKSKGQIATLFNQIDEIGGLLVPICDQADADIRQYLIKERNSSFDNLFKPYYESGLQRSYIYIEITVPNKRELFRKLSNIALKHLKLVPTNDNMQYSDKSLTQYQNVRL